MNAQLRALLRGRDPSLPLAVAALVRRADADGGATFSELAVAYREAHLDLQEVERGDGARQGGVLSVDEVRRHLQVSVLPRLGSANIIALVPTSFEGDHRVAFTPEVWSWLSGAGEGVSAELKQMALDAVRESEAPLETDRPQPTGSTLAARGLTKAYKKRKVVDDVDLSLRQGEIVGLLGPNGAGKTTSFYMIVGLVKPDRGYVTIDEQNISSLPMFKRARAGIGYLAQEPSIFRKLTVEQNVRSILETLALSERAREERLESLLDELSIKYLRNVKAYKLSGGERRRLEITRALVTEPRFMLLDEPFAGVDPIAVNDIQTIVAGLRRRGIGVLITDHSVEQTLDIVDRAYIMFDGMVQVSGTVRELVFNERVADLYLGPTLTTRLRERLGTAA